MITQQCFYPYDLIDSTVDIDKIIYFQPIYLNNYIKGRPNEYFITSCIVMTNTYKYVFKLCEEEKFNLDLLREFGMHTTHISMILTAEGLSHSGWVKFFKITNHSVIKDNISLICEEDCTLTKYIINFKEYKNHILVKDFGVSLTNKQYKWLESSKFSKHADTSYYTIHYRLKYSYNEALLLPVLENVKDSWLKDFPSEFSKPYYNQLKNIKNKHLKEIEKVNKLMEAISEEDRLLFEIEEGDIDNE